MKRFTARAVSFRVWASGARFVFLRETQDSEKLSPFTLGKTREKLSPCRNMCNRVAHCGMTKRKTFQVKDSGERQQFKGGMVRDTSAGKTQYVRVFDGVMLDRWAEHLTKGASKYPDVKPGVPNWLLAQDIEELERFKASAVRHFRQWLRGDDDEDHAAAAFFNINGYETVKETLARQARDARELTATQAVQSYDPFRVGCGCLACTARRAEQDAYDAAERYAKEPTTLNRNLWKAASRRAAAAQESASKP